MIVSPNQLSLWALQKHIAYVGIRENERDHNRQREDKESERLSVQEHPAYHIHFWGGVDGRNHTCQAVSTEKSANKGPSPEGRRGRGCPWPKTVYASARDSLGPSNASGGGTRKHEDLPCTVIGQEKVGEERKIYKNGVKCYIKNKMLN